MSINEKLKQIVKIQAKIKEIIIQSEGLASQQIKLERQMRKLRISKSSKKGYEFEILCYCSRTYDTNKNPDAPLKINRPQCRDCGERLEEKL